MISETVRVNVSHAAITYRGPLYIVAFLMSLFGPAGCGGAGDEGASRRVALPQSEHEADLTLPNDHPTTLPPKRIATH